MIARRRVRLAIREAREALRLTQSDVAEAMEWSLSKVIRIEGGEVSISPNDLRPLLGYLGVRDPATIDELLMNAKAARVRQRRFWWQEERFRDDLTPAMLRLIEFEREALSIKYFSIYSIPGPLQTRLYAEAILSQWQYGLTPDQIAARVEARMHRRTDVLERPDAPRIQTLLDESMVHRPFGGPAVLLDQLTDLRMLAGAGRVDLRIVPFSLEAPLPTYGPFDLIYLREDGDDENAVMYRELGLVDEIVEDSERATQYHTKFEELWLASMPESDTLALLQERIKTLRSTAGHVEHPGPEPTP